jgi:hypothetical protein
MDITRNPDHPAIKKTNRGCSIESSKQIGPPAPHRHPTGETITRSQEGALLWTDAPIRFPAGAGQPASASTALLALAGASPGGQ